jgi:hypothetical protein
MSAFFPRIRAGWNSKRERIVVWEAMSRRFSILDMKGGLIKTAKSPRFYL